MRSTLARRTRHAVIAVLAMDLAAVAALGALPEVGMPSRVVPLERAEIAATAPTAPSTAAAPVAIRADAIEVDAPVIDLGLEADGTLEVPTDGDVAGWWSGGAAPGETGPVVIVGHVNLRSGPGVFLRLGELATGDVITAALADGTEVDYVVTDVEQVPKEHFPTERVYGPTTGSTLRLVTCGGAFRSDDRTYRDNVIVYATLA